MFKANTQNRNGSTRNYFQYSSKKQMRLIIDWRLIFYIYVVFSFPQMSYDFGETELLSEIYYIRSSCQIWKLFYLSVHQIWHLLCLPAILQLSNLRAFIPGSCPCQSRQHRSCCPQWRMGTQVGMCRQKQQEHQPKSKIHVTYGGDICRTKCRSLLQNC